MYLCVVEFGCPRTSFLSSAKAFDKTHNIGDIINQDGANYIIFDHGDGWRVGYRLDMIAEMESDTHFDFPGFNRSERISRFAKINEPESEHSKVTYVFRKSGCRTSTQFLRGE